MAKSKELADAVERHPERLEGMVAALKAEPHTAKASSAFTVKEAKQILLASHEHLSDAELAEVVAFWNCPAGQKERELADAATNKFRDGKRDASLETADPARISRARELVEMANIPGILGGFAGPFRMTPADVEKYLIEEYATSATTAELDAMLDFYRSSTGTKVIAASKTAAARLGKEVNL
jgi:hypothetical protein